MKAHAPAWSGPACRAACSSAPVPTAPCAIARGDSVVAVDVAGLGSQSRWARKGVPRGSLTDSWHPSAQRRHRGRPSRRRCRVDRPHRLRNTSDLRVFVGRLPHPRTRGAYRDRLLGCLPLAVDKAMVGRVRNWCLPLSPSSSGSCTSAAPSGPPGVGDHCRPQDAAQPCCRASARRFDLRGCCLVGNNADLIQQGAHLPPDLCARMLGASSRQRNDQMLRLSWVQQFSSSQASADENGARCSRTSSRRSASAQSSNHSLLSGCNARANTCVARSLRALDDEDRADSSQD